jgi:hypothetical protein
LTGFIPPTCPENRQSSSRHRSTRSAYAEIELVAEGNGLIDRQLNEHAAKRSVFPFSAQSQEHSTGDRLNGKLISLRVNVDNGAWIRHLKPSLSIS